MPSLTLTVGDRRVRRHQALTFSNSDPGGCEMASATSSELAGLQAGAPVSIRYGTEELFYGTLNEPGDDRDAASEQFSMAALGVGEALKRDQLRALYVSSDLGAWRAPSVARRLQLLDANFRLTEHSVIPDESTGAPAMVMVHQLAGNAMPITEAVFDPGEGLKVAKVTFDYSTKNTANTDPYWFLSIISTDDDSTTQESSGDYHDGSTTGTASTYSPSPHRRFVYFQFGYSNTTIASPGYDRTLLLRNVVVLGDHGLSTVGTSLRISDIVRHLLTVRAPIALELSNVMDAPVLTGQAHYPDPTTIEQIVGELATLLGGWHWGIWERRGLDTRPQAFLAPVPAHPTVTADARRCDQLKVPKVRLDALYDSALVRYQSGDGVTHVVTVSIDNPYLDQSGISRTLPLEMGAGTPASAQAYGAAALALQLAAARGSGSCVLPAFVTDAGGGLRPSCTLRAGRDRIRIRNLPDSAIAQLGDDSRRYDTFHVRRVEVTDDGQGEPKTRVEFDGGGDLMETLTARLGQANTRWGL